MQSQATAVGASREFIESSGSIGRIFNIGSSAYSTGKAYSVRTHGRKFEVQYILRSGGRTLVMLIPVLTPATILVVHIAPYGVVYLPASLQGKVGMKIQYCIEPF